MKILFLSVFTLLFIGIYKKYAPICYVWLPRGIFKDKLKVISSHTFLINRKDERKMNIYKTVHFASSIIVFIPFIFSPRIKVRSWFDLLRRMATKA